jgi:hypothetical protein
MPTAQATLSQGSTDFSPFVALDGVEQDWIERAESSVVTLDGTLWKQSVRKRKLTVRLHDMFHEDLRALFDGKGTLAPWSYLDSETGPRTAWFYRSGPAVRQQLARGGKTLCAGISFTLEEK